MDRDADLERRQDLRADLLAHRVHVVDAAAEAVRPDDAAVRRVHELDEDDDLRVRRLDGAPQAVAHAQQAPDLVERGARCLQPERRAARGDEQPAQAGRDP